MAAAQYDIIVEQHQDFARAFSLAENGVPIDLTNHTFTAQLRERTQATTGYNFEVTVVDALQGLINMVMTDTITSTITPGWHVYDLIMTRPDGDKVRLLEGQAQVKAGVTR